MMKAVRSIALSSFSAGTRMAEICELWASRSGDGDARLASRAKGSDSVIVIARARIWRSCFRFAGADEVERAIGADAVQPGGEGCASVEFSSDLFPGFEKRFLHHILRVDFIGGHTISEPEDSFGVALDEHPKSIADAAPRLVYGDIVACIHPVVRLGLVLRAPGG